MATTFDVPPEPGEHKTVIWLEFVESEQNGGTWIRLWEQFDTVHDAIQFARWLDRQRPHRKWRYVQETWLLHTRHISNLDLEE